MTKRALELAALAAILPMDRRDRLAEILTDEDVATLKHLAKEGMGENSLRALASDLAYLEAWVLAATGTPLPWPAPEALALKFVAHHLWDPARRDTDPGHGMPDTIAAALWAEGLLRADGPHAPATVRRRLSSWATLHHWKGLAGPFRSPALRSAIRLAVRRVVQADWENPGLDAWRARIVEDVARASRPVVFVAHSLGVLAVAHAASFLAKGANSGKVKGGFFVAPPSANVLMNFEAVDPALLTLPGGPLPFPSLVIASRDDPFSPFADSEELARALGAELIDAGFSGHINIESGHGPWPEGLMRFAGFLKTL